MTGRQGESREVFGGAALACRPRVSTSGTVWLLPWQRKNRRPGFARAHPPVKQHRPSTNTAPASQPRQGKKKRGRKVGLGLAASHKTVLGSADGGGRNFISSRLDTSCIPASPETSKKGGARAGGGASAVRRSRRERHEVDGVPVGRRLAGLQRPPRRHQPRPRPRRKVCTSPCPPPPRFQFPLLFLPCVILLSDGSVVPPLLYCWLALAD
jgi:hypothetical protein